MSKENVKNRRQQFHQEYTSALKQEIRLLEHELVKNLAEVATGFTPSFLYYKEIENQTKDWAIQKNVWIKGKGEHYNTMFCKLHPDSYDNKNPEQPELLWAGKFYALLYFIDDIFGNDSQINADPTQIAHLRKFISELIGVFWMGSSIPKINPNAIDHVVSICKALTELLQDLSTLNTPTSWNNFFYNCLAEHLGTATANYELAIDEGQFLNAEVYSSLRIKVAGMNFAEAIMELVTRNFSPRKESLAARSIAIPSFANLNPERWSTIIDGFSAVGIDLYQSKELASLINSQNNRMTLVQFRQVMSYLGLSIGSEWNDVKSLPKEIQEKTMFNLVTIAYLANMDLSPISAIQSASAYIDAKTNLFMWLRSIFHEQFLAIVKELKIGVQTDHAAIPEEVMYMFKHIEALTGGGLQATFDWQSGNKRYESDEYSALVVTKDNYLTNDSKNKTE